MNLDYWAIYHPEHGYYLGKKPKFGNFRYGARYVFGYNLRPTLYKDPTAATAAFNAIPAEARKGAIQILNSLLGKKGTLEDISVFLGWTETAFKEARAVIRDVISMENDEE